MIKKTFVTKPEDIKREWHLVDVQGKILGREATKIALLLMGKNKPYFTRNMDVGDYVVVVNAKKVRLSGRKEKQKVYRSYSGYPGGLHEVSFEKMREEQPEKVIRHAVWGMLPKNKLRARLIRRLYVFADENHPYKDKFSVSSSK